MEKRIVFTDANGNCCVVMPAYNDLARPVGETEDELLERVVAQAVPAGVLFHVVDASLIPIDRTFRNAWEADGNGVPRVNMLKVK